MLPEERFRSSTFTEVFVEQLMAVATAVPSREAGGLAADRAAILLQAHITGGQRVVLPIVECLEALGLVTSVDGVLARTRSGNVVRKEIRTGGTSAPFALVLIRSGFMGDQVRALREVLELSGGTYRCNPHRARSAAPQLVGLLARLPDVRVGHELEIGTETSREIDSLWNEVLPSSRIDWSDSERRRKAIGDRAESYSMEFERTRRPGVHSEVAWVSRDDDALGYDIEVGTAPLRRIEVKGSTGPEVIFYLTAREYEVATEHADRYELQFWGTIDMKADPRADYERLRRLGYPLRIANPISQLQNDPWAIVPDRHRVSASARVGTVEMGAFTTPLDAP